MRSDDRCRQRLMWERARSECLRAAIAGFAFGAAFLVLAFPAASLIHLSPFFSLCSLAFALSGVWLIHRSIRLVIEARGYQRNLGAMREGKP